MTIIAGFKSCEGVVLCADTQETVERIKRNVPKLIFEPSNLFSNPNTVDDLAVAFCGSGYGPLIDKLVSEAWKEAKAANSLDDACGKIEESIKNQYRDFGGIYQVGQCPEVELIFGVKMQRNSRLFSASGPIVNEKRGYDSSGTGQYMADFLAARMYKEHLTLYQCVILAAYVLAQAKEHVEGCGGDSQIAVLREDGVSGLVDWRRVEVITNLLRDSDRHIGELLLHTANLDMEDSKVKEEIEIAMSVIDAFRGKERDELKRWDEMSILFGPQEPKDFLGLPIVEDDSSAEQRE